MTIHKEGRSFLAILLLIFILLNMGIAFSSISKEYLYFSMASCLVLFLLVLQFFRNPHVIVPVNTNLVLAPADGKVVVIEETDETEYLKERRIQVSIFMSPVNVHVNRNPVGGVIKYMKYHSGKYLVAWHPKSSIENERTTIVYQMANGLEILTRQIAGALARRIKFYIKENDAVVQGEEFGFIKFGSRVDVFLPLNAKVMVQVGEKTRGGKTVIASLS